MGRSTQRSRQESKARAKSGYKFQNFVKEAEKRREATPERPEIEPFVIDDVEPPIVITAPDTVERQLVIAELAGARDGVFDPSQSLPLLRALCGDQFGRVWMLVRDDHDPFVLIPLIQAMMDHFGDVLANMREAEEDLPGGSGDSSI